MIATYDPQTEQRNQITAPRDMETNTAAIEAILAAGIDLARIRLYRRLAVDARING